MKRALLGLLLCPMLLPAQGDLTKIKAASVKRIIQTLSADSMNGRPALNPVLMEPAAAFIEQEFVRIGLRPLPGAEGFRQTFFQDRIRREQVSLTLDGSLVPEDRLVIISDQTSLTMTDGLVVSRIGFESNKLDNNTFFAQVSQMIRDTVSRLLIVAPAYEAQFQQIQSYIGLEHPPGGTQRTAVLVLGEYAGASVQLSLTQSLVRLPLSNIVGMVQGVTRPDEYVVFSGHYDHLGIISAVGGDSIANGADDDASGVTAVIELARYFAGGAPPARTLIFVAFTAEEVGGYGSQYFASQIVPDQVVAMFNIEMIGKPSKWGKNYAFITGFERSDFGRILQQNVFGSRFTFMPDPYPDQQLFYRSDNATLARLGVPAHTISTDQIDTDPYYHTVDDEYKTLDVKNITATIQAIALGAGSIVAGKDTPTRIEKAN